MDLSNGAMFFPESKLMIRYETLSLYYCILKSSRLDSVKNLKVLFLIFNEKYLWKSYVDYVNSYKVDLIS